MRESNLTTKPPTSEVESQFAAGEIEFHKLYGVFGGVNKIAEEILDDAVVAYQKDLAKVVYPNGMQLKDYHVYGVSWMMANYLNGRSSLVADDRGIGYVGFPRRVILSLPRILVSNACSLQFQEYCSVLCFHRYLGK